MNTKPSDTAPFERRLPFVETPYNPLTGPIPADIATFLQEITMPPPVVTQLTCGADAPWPRLAPKAWHEVDRYLFFDLLRGSAAIWSTLLGNYVWIEEHDGDALHIMWVDREGFFVRGVPAKLKEPLGVLASLVIENPWKIG